MSNIYKMHLFTGLPEISGNGLGKMIGLSKAVNAYLIHHKTKVEFIVTKNVIDSNFFCLEWQRMNPGVETEPRFFSTDHFLITVMIKNPNEFVQFDFSTRDDTVFIQTVVYVHPLDRQ